MKTFSTLLKISVALCLMMSGKAAAQHSVNDGVFTGQTTPAQQTTFKTEAMKNIAEAITNKAIVAPQFAETKIQKRVRKMKDPILIPYALNKKNFSIC